jgi:Tfp pilus assembly protein PilO
MKLKMRLKNLLLKLEEQKMELKTTVKNLLRQLPQQVKI